ncbi:hypothetical protein DSO57_1030314 [Entomophthora muscae]|uniref:Uncharacterized protein n=1 Tax=Entomophthora muscae TaxID=34485 RepID=A0ACC2U9Z0_9FUNG|nr:hypothetical protein DSO57_1030314 [Entomophthora muscae]
MEDVTSCRGEFRRVPYKPSCDPWLLKDGSSCNQVPHPAPWLHQPPGRASLKVAGARQHRFYSGGRSVVSFRYSRPTTCKLHPGKGWG